MVANQLASAIDEARGALELNPSGELPVGYRHAIWACLGPKKTSDDIATNTGWLRRAHLALLTVTHVLPLWEHRFPENPLLTMILSETSAVLDGDTPGDAESKYDTWEMQINKLASLHPDSLPAIAVGGAALRAYAAAIYDEESMPETIDYSLTDDDCDIESVDASVDASYAAANGYLTDAASSPEKRREFWTWWLDEAVPAAYNAVPDDTQQ